MTLEKPAKRRPKPRKRIARSSKPIARKRAPRAFRKGAKAAAKRLTKAEWSRTVRESYGGRCVYCYTKHPATDAAHIVPVGVRKAMEVDPDNGLPLCRDAHIYLTKRPVEWDLFAEAFVGPQKWVRLMERKRATS